MVSALRTLEGHRDVVSSVAVCSDRIVSGSYDKTVKIWNTDGECIKTLEGHSDCVESVARCSLKIGGVYVANVCDRIVSGSRDKTVKIWNIDGKCLKTLKGHSDGVRSVNIMAPQNR